MKYSDKNDRSGLLIVWFLLIVMVVITWLRAYIIVSTAHASTPRPLELNSVQCGVRPVPPVGCSRQSAVCACDSDNNCEWVFTDC